MIVTDWNEFNFNDVRYRCRICKLKINGGNREILDVERWFPPRKYFHRTIAPFWRAEHGRKPIERAKIHLGIKP